jgi:hypothetical protein
VGGEVNNNDGIIIVLAPPPPLLLPIRASSDSPLTPPPRGGDWGTLSSIAAYSGVGGAVTGHRWHLGMPEAAVVQLRC